VEEHVTREAAFFVNAPQFVLFWIHDIITASKIILESGCCSMKKRNDRSTAFFWKALVYTLPIVLVFSFMACQTRTEPAQNSAGAQATTAVETAMPADTPTATIEPTPAETASEPTGTVTPATFTTPAPVATAAVTIDDLVEVLEEINALQNGSAGISLKQALAAAKLLDWAEGTAMTRDGIAEVISGYMGSLSNPEAVGTFCINFNIVSDLPQKIIDGDAGTLGTVSSAGYTLAHSAYTQAKWEILLSAYTRCLPGMYTSYADMAAFDAETGWAMFDYWDMLRGEEAADWLVTQEGYSEADAQDYADNMADSEFIKKNTNPRLRVVDMRNVSITMMYHADGTPVLDAVPVALTYSEFMSLYAANPDGVLHSYFYYITVSGGKVTEVGQPYWP